MKLHRNSRITELWSAAARDFNEPLSALLRDDALMTRNVDKANARRVPVFTVESKREGVVYAGRMRETRFPGKTRAMLQA